MKRTTIVIITMLVVGIAGAIYFGYRLSGDRTAGGDAEQYAMDQDGGDTVGTPEVPQGDMPPDSVIEGPADSGPDGIQAGEPAFDAQPGIGDDTMDSPPDAGSDEETF